MKKNMKKIGIASIMLVLVLLLGLAGWLIFGRRETNVGVQEAANELGIEWYDEDGTEFTISTAEELFEFQKLSGYYDFAGQTIKLGADIVVNEGNARDWADKKDYPEKVWESVYGFAGTFDGQGHTISGIYCLGFLYTSNLFRLEQTDYVTAGLFRRTQPECVIKNFRLVNSFFDSDLNYGAGCISSNGGGTFDSIYVDAILNSQKNYVGGIVGRATEDISITNCWFDGEINVIGGYARPTGGILGQPTKDKKCIIEHCLMSGTIYNDLYKKGVNMGGILGTTKDAKVTINDCLVSGTLHNDWQIVGSAVGNVTLESIATISHVYTTKEAWQITIGHTSGQLEGTPVAYEKEKLLGYGGYQWTSLDFDNYWAAVEGGTPVLKTFAEDALSLDGVARMVDLTWYDETKDVFEIHDVPDFYGFALLSYSHNFEGKTVKLCTDITINTGKASEWMKNAPEYDWISIGSSNLPFKGTFDGQMHTISGVYMVADKSYNGLFGVTANEAVIKNFSLKNSYFESSAASFGSIAGRGIGKYDTIYSNAIIRSSNANAGGIIGQVTGAGTLSVNNCWFDGSVTMTANERTCRKFGGIIGVVFKETKLTNCLNTGTIDGSIYSCTNSDTSKNVQPYIGGLIGQIHGNGTATLSYCLNVGEVKHNKAATTSYAATIGTASGKAKISHVYATKESCERAMNGYITGQTIVYDEARLKGYGGYKWTTLNFDKYWAVVENDTSILRSFAKKRPSVSGVARMIDTSWYDEKADTYVLQDVADLYGLALLSYTSNFEGKTVKLGADITINEGNAADWANAAPENEWMSIGSSSLPFAGTFDGQMHTISGVYLTADRTYSGFFTKTSEKAVVKNVKLTNGYMSSDYDNFGSIVGLTAGGTFDTIYSDVIMSAAGNNVGGLIGRMQGDFDFAMKNCWFDGSVTNTGGTNCMGGLVGRIFESKGKMRTITNCLNTGEVVAVESTSRHIGGLVGHSNSKQLIISESMNTGTIGYNKAISSSNLQTYGSIIGNAQAKATVTNTYATSESCTRTINGSVNGKAIVYNENRIKGYGGYQWTTLDFDTSKGYWAVVLTDTPILRSFAATVPEINVARMLDISWYNDKDTTFTLDTSAELFGFALLSVNNNFAGKTIELGADIDIANEGNAENWAENEPQYEWLSIGTSSLPFAGTFDGKMHNISGVYLKADTTYAGLFGRTSAKATVKNFSMTNSYFYSDYDNLGSIAGQANGGTFDTIYSDAIVDANGNNSGGLIGRMQGDANFVMNNCCFDGSITNKGGTNCLGGLIGRVFKASGYTRTITNCLNAGDLEVTSVNTRHVGALIGHAEMASLNYQYCLNTGRIEFNPETSKDNFATYGLGIGTQSGKAVSSNPAIHSITQDDYGKDAEGNTIKAHAKSVGYTAAESQIKGTDVLTKFRRLFATQDNEGKYKGYFAIVPGQTPVLASFGHLVEPLEEYKTVEPKFITIETSWYDGSGKYTLSNASELYGFATLSNITDAPLRATKNLAVDLQDAEVKLDADITINQGKPYGEDNVAGTTDDWTPAYGWNSMFASSYDVKKNDKETETLNASFNGSFDGQGHKISGIYLNTASQYQGLFGRTGTTVEIRNVRLTDSYFQNTADNIGSIVGRTEGGTFDTIYSDAIVRAAGNNVGGLIGRMQGDADFNMNNCWFDGSVTNTGGTSNMGGLVGRIFESEGKTRTITNCLNTGDVIAEKSTSRHLGGVVGSTNSKSLTISDTMNTGKLRPHEGISSDDIQTYGAIIGTTNNEVAVVNTFATTESCARTINGSVNGGVISYNEDRIKGYGGCQWTTLDFDTNKGYWAVVLTDTPILRSFATTVPEINVARMLDISWYNDKDTTFTLNTSAELFGFALLSTTNNFAGKTIELGADIDIPNEGDATDWATNAPQYEWLGIGTNSLPFAGTFDGQMHNISGVYLKADTVYAGFFGRTSQEAIVKNFSMTNSYFYSDYDNFGSIVGQANGGTFDTIYSDAIVRAAGNNVGGLIGRMQGNADFNMNNCWFKGSVTNTGGTSNMGGLVGRIFESEGKTRAITNCLNTGDVTAEEGTSRHVGGVVGHTISKNLTISDTMNTGKIYNHPDISSDNIQTYGAIIGTTTEEVTVVNTIATKESFNRTINGSVKGKVIVYNKDKITGYGGYQWTTWNFDTIDGYWAVVLTDTPILRSFATSVPEINVDRVVDITWYNDNDTEFTIDTYQKLYGLAWLSVTNNFAGKTIELGADIDIPNEGDTASWATNAPQYEWMSIGTSSLPFAGTFDGQMHNISGVYMKADAVCAGFFGKTSPEATVKNFRMTNSYFYSDYDNFGSIAGEAQGGTFDSIYSNAYVISGGQSVGGLIGCAEGDADFAMNNCWFAGNVTNNSAKNNIGGLIGELVNASGKFARTITNCLNTGVVTAESSSSEFVGALVGFNGNGPGLTISNCLNTKEIVYNSELSADNLKDQLYGLIGGQLQVKTELNSVYTISQENISYSGNLVSPDETYIVDKTKINGTDALENMSNLFTYQENGKYKNHWAITQGAPVLSAFADVAGVQHQAVDTSWFRTDETSFTLMDAADLYGLALLSRDSVAECFENETIYLGADIVMNEGIIYDENGPKDSTTPPIEWISIGTVSDQFKGTFDGQGKTISGIYMQADTAYSGLFAAINTTSGLKDFKLTNSYFDINSKNYAGSIVGYVYNGSLDSIYSDAFVLNGAQGIGGLCGSVHNAATTFKMNNCWFNGAVTAKNNFIGGLLGNLGTSNKSTAPGEITNCLNTGSVNVTADTSRHVGGLFGYNYSPANALVIKNSMNSGEIGYTFDPETEEETITDNTGTYFVIGSTGKALDYSNLYAIYNDDALVQTALLSKFATTNCISYSNNATDGLSIAGAKALTAETKSLFTYVTDETTYANKSYWAITQGAPVLSAFADVAGVQHQAVDTSWFTKTANTFTLTDAADLYGLALLSRDEVAGNFANETIYLGADIVMNEGITYDSNGPKDGATPIGWISIGTVNDQFKGTFDGKGHNISGVYLNSTTERSNGLFGDTSGATLNDFSLTDSYFYSQYQRTGSIAGMARGGTFKGIYSSAIVSSSTKEPDAAAKDVMYVGGIIGYVQNANFTMDNCWFKGIVTGSATNSIGGLVGYIKSDATAVEMTNCLNSGIVNPTNSSAKYVGGLIAYCGPKQMTLMNCLNTGTIVNSSSADTTKNQYGLISGYLQTTVATSGVYTIQQADIAYAYSSNAAGAYIVDDKYVVDKEEILGKNAESVLLELFASKTTDGEDYWVITTTTPVLKTFEKFAVTE